ncbi:Ras-related protein RIC1 [Tritrichomonas foetus]|uniref:Ras-related protein RIC1 n=1 Tax=Tritrichomonas foetus TaxID=1144522 RepID=A0A1J4JVC5_9EUKA|nr:Ras-related protein RIC1 [Tritrichomonas foetus]|eukprot:OHT01478.1 Ras-related protein RIC1 [Tritrichomonas foetus]
MATQDYMFKLLVVGESGVGKTCMLLRFADNKFEENFLSTIGVDFKVKEIMVDDKKVKLQIWDSAGQERFRNITASYYRNCSAIIIVYDITNHDSFDRVQQWVTDVRGFVPDAPLLLVGNKCDLEEDRKVTIEEGKGLADKLGFVFLETSAKTALNIENVFMEMSKTLIKQAQDKPQKAQVGKVVDPTKPPKEKRKKNRC